MAADDRAAKRPNEDDRVPGVPPHQPPPDPEKDDPVDEVAEESFPGSDAPSTGGPGL